MQLVQVMSNNTEVPCKLIQFSDGSCTLQVDTSGIPTKANRLVFTVFPCVPVSQAVDACRQFIKIISDADCCTTNMILNLPYFPYGRADRAFEFGMLNLRSEFIEEMLDFFTEILTEDLHSKDNRVNSISKLQVFKEGHRDLANRFTTICFPDAGASKDTEDFAKAGYEIIQCSKKRNPVNGWITHYSLESGTAEGKDVLIVDDICDGGKTFELCAQSLLDAGAKSVSLYVTHGIFSKGLDLFKDVLYTVHCNNVVGNYVNRDQLNRYNQGKL